jgi:hypothetical protein
MLRTTSITRQWGLGLALVAVSAFAAPAIAADHKDHKKGKDKQAKSQMKDLEIDLPDPQFTGTPGDLPVDELNLDPKRVKRLDNKSMKRKPLQVPAGVKLLSKGKPVTASEDFPIIGSPDLVTDGDASHTVGTYLELGPGKQWVQVDLEGQYEIYAVAIWHYHNKGRVYRDVIVQVSEDDNFDKGVKTVFNNDNDNSLGLGAGDDYEYIENHEGRVIQVDGVKGRYVRCYSNGNTSNAQSHYIEVKVYGQKPGQSGKQTAQAEGSN